MLLDLDRPRSFVDAAFRTDVLQGLAARPRAIPARWFYDAAGSALFEEITRLPEYYPTRTETALLRKHGSDIAHLAGRGRAVIELGSGSSAKTPWLLDAIEPAAYVPIDISGEFLRKSAASLAERFPNLPVLPVEADFLEPLRLPPAIEGMPRLGFFPGSTIGNLVPEKAVDLLRALHTSLGDGSLLLIGMDRIKSTDILIPAYDDAQGVTAGFNLNLLARINRELEGDIPIGAFRHRALWNEDQGRIEMHLEAMRNVRFTVAGRSFEMTAGETIHTENSHKYGPREARMLLGGAGWHRIGKWTDPDGLFMLVLAEARPTPSAP